MSVVAKRYSEAYLSSAEERKVLDAAGADSAALLQLIDDSEPFAAFLQYPGVSPEKQTQCLEKLFKGKVDPLTLQFLQLLVQKERLSDLRDILGQALEGWRARKGILQVSVVAAEAFSDDQIKALKKKLADRTGKTIELTVEVDPGLIGGFQLNLQGMVEDYSLAAKLNTFKRNVLNA
jgi:F-type H+-transporting ATPase subunit delta